MKQEGTLTHDVGIVVVEYQGEIAPAFMGRKLAPPMMVPDDKGHYDKLLFAEMRKQVGDIRHADGSAFARVRHTVTQDSYEAYDYALEEPIPNAQKLRNLTFDQEVAAGQNLIMNIMIKEEIRWASVLFNAVTFASYKTTLGTEWSNIAADIIGNVADGKLSLTIQVGGFINPIQNEVVLAVSEKVFVNMQKNTGIKAASPGGTGADVTNKQLVSQERMAVILGIDAVEVGGLQDGGADIWDDEYALLSLRAKTPGSMLNDPNKLTQLARTLIWEKMASAEAVYEVYEEKTTDSVVARARQYQDEKLLNIRAGHLFENVTA